MPQPLKAIRYSTPYVVGTISGFAVRKPVTASGESHHRSPVYPAREAVRTIIHDADNFPGLPQRTIHNRRQ